MFTQYDGQLMRLWALVSRMLSLPTPNRAELARSGRTLCSGSAEIDLSVSRMTVGILCASQIPGKWGAMARKKQELPAGLTAEALNTWAAWVRTQAEFEVVLRARRGAYRTHPSRRVHEASGLARRHDTSELLC